VDCADRKVRNVIVKGKGFYGGNFDDAFSYVQKHGLMLHTDYPLRWFWGHGNYRYNVKKIVDWVVFEALTEEELMRVVAKRPVAVALDHFPLDNKYNADIIELEDWPPAMVDEKNTYPCSLAGWI
jgi:hypothetical protein